MDRSLRCSDSSQQIIFSNNHAWSQQAKNLIIFDIDDVILEHAYGHHGVIPDFQQNPFELHVDKTSGLELLLLNEPYPVTIIFKKHFFETLHFIQANVSADMVKYTRSSADYAQQIRVRIDEMYQNKFGKIRDGTDSIFKMVISRKGPKTAKTISTLSHKLKLSDYERIIILDESADDIWCKHELMQLEKQHINVKIDFIECSSFEIWKNVYENYWQWYAHNVNERLSYPLSVTAFVMHHSEYFCSFIMRYRENDTQFEQFTKYLQSLSREQKD